jgi:DNA-3-methyladenine glycosylase
MIIKKNAEGTFMKKLERSFYERETLAIARELLGKYMIHDTSDGRTSGKIVEVEAYMGSMGARDAASHAYNGKFTNRTKIMFGQGGHAYIYLIYGMYYCMNIVTNQEHYPEAVLIRAIEPIDGIDLMKRRRGTDKVLNLCSGPGKLCAAMGLSKVQNEMDLCGESLYLLSGERVSPECIVSTPRINIDYAQEARNYPWRFIIKDNPFVSKGK